ncbi:MAG TPA: hypothetical protein VF398_04720 [bacterium]|jgi:hypothetical protein
MQLDRKTYYLTNDENAGKAWLWVGIIGILLSAGGFILNPERSLQSYLVAFVFWTSLGLGALFFTMLHHLSGAVWSVVVRRISETVMANLPFMAIFFLPVLFGFNTLFEWAHHDSGAAHELLAQKSPFLNVPFFIIRAAAYFLIWSMLVYFLYRTSTNQDDGHEESHSRRFRKVSAPGMILFAFTCTFAAIDWMMSLDPNWYSTIIGVYFFSGSISAVLPLIILISLYLRRQSILTEEITLEHYHDLAKLTFAFNILWSYMAFSQYFLIWYGNIPEETAWYHHRWGGSWTPVSLFLPFAHFVVPFFVLMSRAAKRSTKLLVFISLWLLMTHWIDMSWLVLPNFARDGAIYSWTDLTCTLGIGGIFLFLFWRRLTVHPVVPVGDPRLQESIEFINI